MVKDNACKLLFRPHQVKWPFEGHFQVLMNDGPDVDVWGTGLLFISGSRTQVTEVEMWQVLSDATKEGSYPDYLTEK